MAQSPESEGWEEVVSEGWEEVKPQSDPYQEAIKGSRAQFIQPGSPLSGTAVEAGLAVLEQPAAGVYGLASQAWAALKGTYKGALASFAGLPFGEVFREEFEQTAKNMADAYVPITPGGELIAHKLSDIITRGIMQFAEPTPTFELTFEKGKRRAVRTGEILNPAQSATAQGIATLGLLVAGTPGKPKPGAPKPTPDIAPMSVLDDFKANYPQSAAAIDASSLGAVRFKRTDASIADAVNRQINEELGFTGDTANLPFSARAAMVFDKVAPEVPLAEKMKAVRAMEKKIELLDQARVARADERGLPLATPEARPGEGPVLVTPDGVAVTSADARMLDREFLSKTPSERADALGVSLAGQLRLQAEAVKKEIAGGTGSTTEFRGLQKMWEQAFPDFPPQARQTAIEKFLNFDGQMSFPDILEAHGKGTSRRADIWRQTERGAIDIEGIDYLLNSFKELPDQPVLKRATIVGQINRSGVTQAEKDVVLKALRDKDTITKGELTGSVAADILPLRAKELRTSDAALEDHQLMFTGLQRLGGRVDELRARVWEMPLRTDLYNHFDNPNYFAHTRGFDKGPPANTRGLTIMQREDFDSFAAYDKNLKQQSPTFKTIDQARNWLGGLRTRYISEIQSDLMQGGLREVGEGHLAKVKELIAQIEKTHPAEGISHRVLGWIQNNVAAPEWEFDFSRDAALRLLKEELAIGTTREVEPRLTHLEKRWYERILMEENRQAAKDGIDVMRVATPDTMAFGQMWIRALKNGEHKFSTPLEISVNPIESERNSYTVLKAKAEHGILQSVLVGPDQYRGLRWLNPQLLGRGIDSVIRQMPKEGFNPEHQGIYRFYEQSVIPFVRARWDAKQVSDAYGNTWMEWKVKPGDADKKIPAFGGRQRGSIDIPEFEDVVQGLKRGEEAAKAAAARGWTAPGPADDQLYNKARAAFDKSREAELKGFKQSSIDILKRARREVVAHDYDLRKELEVAGEYGQNALDRLVLQNGATMGAKTHMDRIMENIYGTMDQPTKQAVDELMRLRRIIEIDSYKGVGKHKHPEGINGPQAEAVALRMQKELGEEQFARVYAHTNAIMKEYKDILSRRYQGGLLSDESYLKLLHFDYSPVEFIDLLDPMQTYNIKGHKISVRTSGVPYLERGKKGNVVMDSRLLLAEALVRSENLISKNNTLQALHTLAAKQPENGVTKLPAKGTVGVTRDGEPYLKHAEKGWTGLGVRWQGKQDFVLMREDLAEQFVHRPEAMREWVATMARWLSGSQTVKATATTYNPMFIVAGLPMDILHTWLATSGQYSPHLPIFLGQMAMDMTATAKAAWLRGPKYQEAMAEGLGSAFMTHEGRGFSGVTDASLSVTEKQMLPRYDKLKGALSFINESADIWVRLAHRNRLINEGAESWQATARARDRLDYSVGGPFSRAVDTVLPYTNVAVNSLTKVVQAGKRDPVDLGIKLAWAGGAITSWTLANMISSPETWQQIPTSDKIRSLPITFGDQLFVIDPDGTKRYFYMPGVRLDATVGPLSATIVAGLEKAEYNKVPDDIAKRAMQNLNPVLELSAPPTIEAIYTYLSNFDAFTGRPITPHFSKTLPQDEGQPYGRGPQPGLLARIAGEQLGMSPPRLEAAARKVINPNNLYLSLMGWGFKQLYEGSDPREQAEAVEQAIVKNPAVRPFLKLTNPSTRYMAGMEEKEQAEGSRRKQMTDSVDNMLFEVRQRNLTIKDVQTYIANQSPEDREWLARYAVTGYKVKEIMQKAGASEGIPHEGWWRAVSALEARPRAQEFYSQWLSADAEGRRKMEMIAKGLHNAGAGFYSDAFRRELMREQRLLGTEER